MGSKTVTVGVYFTPVLAQRAADALSDAGIEAEVWGGDSSLVGIPGAGEVRVVVAQDALERARAVIAEAEREGASEESRIGEEDLTRLALEAAPESPGGAPGAEVQAGQGRARTLRLLSILLMIVGVLVWALISRG